MTDGVAVVKEGASQSFSTIERDLEQLVDVAIYSNGETPASLIHNGNSDRHDVLVNHPWARVRNALLVSYPDEKSRREKLSSANKKYKEQGIGFTDALAILGTNKREWQRLCQSVKEDERPLLPIWLINRHVRKLAEEQGFETKDTIDGGDAQMPDDSQPPAEDPKKKFIKQDDGLLWVSAEMVLRDHMSDEQVFN